MEWFWRGKALHDWRQSTPLPSARSREFAVRSTVSKELAQGVVTSADPFGEAIGCELYRQSIFWALCALAPSGDAPLDDSQAVWALLDDDLLKPLAASVEQRQALRDWLTTGDFVTAGALSATECAAFCVALDALNGTLQARFTERQRGPWAIRQQRALRLGGALACLLTVLAFVLVSRARSARSKDFAFGAEWRTSSNYWGGGCTSPDQECENKTGWFFHTAETDNEPWIEFDLGRAKSFSTVIVENREDCCAERAVPLLLEVGDDQDHWHPVLKQDEAFTTWRATFPKVRGRWLRLRLLGPGPLHLKKVQIYK